LCLSSDFEIYEILQYANDSNIYVSVIICDVHDFTLKVYTK
jgi:hypothetical protein